ncbi:tetratricopeptide repeat protein [bacterium]|nr:tetratricopeptide repeat protein [bacterium]
MPPLADSLRQQREAYDPNLLPPWDLRLGLYLFCAATAFVILSLTAYTYNIDDVKIPGLFIGGGVCLAYWSLLLVGGRIEAPPRLVWIPYVCYLAACTVSTMTAAPFAKWIGWYYVQYNTALLGFVLLGSSVITTKKMAELALKFWVLLTFVTTAFGLIHYSGLLEAFYRATWGDLPLVPERRLQALVKTFTGARSMLSTILNVQFFGNFLLMTLPITLSCLVIIFRNLQRMSRAGQNTARPMTWSVIAGLTMVFTLTCVFTTYAKSSIFLLPAILLVYAAAVYLFCGIRRIPYFGLMVVLGIIMGATVLAFVWADLTRELKNVEESMAPRRIIWGGAWQMFTSNPLLGVGPGAFRIYFPEYRSPDYHLTRISNVTMYAHNWLLDIFAETGALGAVAYLAFLGSICWLAWRALRTCPDPVLRIAVVGGILAIGGLLGGSSTTPMSRWPVGSVSLHAIIGTALGIVLLALRDPAKVLPTAPPFNKLNPWPPVRQFHAVLAVAAVAFALSVTHKSTRMFEAAYYHNEGLGISEGIPAHLLGDGTVITNPRVAEYFRQAEALFDRSLELNPNSPTTLYKLAHVHNRLGETEAALEDYRRLRELSPDYAEVHFNLAVIYYNLAAETKDSQSEKAREYMAESRKAFDRASQLSNKISVWYYRANAYEISPEYYPVGSPEEAKFLAEAGDVYLHCSTLPVSQVIQEDNQVQRETELRASALRKAADCYGKAGEWLKAAQAAELYLKQAPQSLSALQLAVFDYQKGGKPEEALRVIDERLAANPLNGDLQFLRYTTLRDAGRTAEAELQGKFLLVLQSRLAEMSTSLLSPEKINALRAQLASTAPSPAPQVTP